MKKIEYIKPEIMEYQIVPCTLLDISGGGSGGGDFTIDPEPGDPGDAASKGSDSDYWD